jgi:hypothetical protein
MTKYACCKPMFQVFQVSQMYVANVSSRCYNSISCCCTCCNGLHAHVSTVFTCMLQMFHLDISKIDLGVCTCCNGLQRMFHMHVSSVSSVFRRMFANISFGCFISRSSVAHVAMALMAGHHLLLVCELPDQCHALSWSPAALAPGLLSTGVGSGGSEDVRMGGVTGARPIRMRGMEGTRSCVK